MNDPWSNLVETLAGNERQTPATWPQRNVHRIMDDSLVADPQPRSRVLRSMSPPPVRYATVMPPKRPEPALRLRCPCTNCVAERALRNAA